MGIRKREKESESQTDFALVQTYIHKWDLFRSTSRSRYRYGSETQVV